MIVKYRILQSKWPDENWSIRGIMYENHGSILKAYPILYSMMLSDPKEIKGDSFKDIVADLEERYLRYKKPEGLRRELAVLAESDREYRVD